MTDQEALLASILSSPHDDTPRLIYADWCEENGDAERAEFIRYQIDLARGPNGIKKAVDIDDADERQKWLDKVQWLSHRQFRLAADNPEWWPDGWFMKFDSDGCQYPRPTMYVCRGFASRVRCSCDHWLAHADKLTWWPERKCEKCEGEGDYLDAAGYAAVENGTLRDWVKLTCPPCRGKGSIPGATMPCPMGMCRGGLADATSGANPWKHCKICSGSGRVPRPVMLAMQPITEVTLMTLPDFQLIPEEWRSNDAKISSFYLRRLRERWPSVEKWNLPTRPEFELRGLPLPIIHADFTLTRLMLELTRGGYPASITRDTET